MTGKTSLSPRKTTQPLLVGGKRCFIGLETFFDNQSKLADGLRAWLRNLGRAHTRPLATGRVAAILALALLGYRRWEGSVGRPAPVDYATAKRLSTWENYIRLAVFC